MPFEYPEEVRKEVLDCIAEGMTVRQISRLPGMPNYRVILRWCQHDPDFKAAVQDAKTVGYQEIVDRLRRVAKGEQGFSTGDVRRDQLVVELDKWVLSKWDPQTYGDRVAVEHSGQIDIPVSLTLEHVSSALERAMTLMQTKLIEHAKPKLLIEHDDSDDQNAD